MTAPLRLRRPRRTAGRLLAACFLVAAGVAALAALVGSPAGADPAPEAALAALDALPTPAAARARHTARIREIMAREKEQAAALEAEFAAAADEQAALRIQRRIQDLRQQTEIELLRAQADHARQLGRPEAAARIEADIRQLQDPDRAARLAHPDTDRPAPGNR